GLFGVACNIEIKRSHAFFCSQFVAHMLEKSKVATFTKKTSLVTPDDLAQLPQFECIFQGKLEDFLEETTIHHAPYNKMGTFSREYSLKQLHRYVMDSTSI